MKIVDFHRETVKNTFLTVSNAARPGKAGRHFVCFSGDDRLHAQNRCFPMIVSRGRLQIQELVAVLGLK